MTPEPYPALELLKAATACESALKLCVKALNKHEGIMPRGDAQQLVIASLDLQLAANNLLRIGMNKKQHKHHERTK